MEARFTPDVDLLIHTLHADLRGIHRVDLEVYDADDALYMRVEALPFDAQTGVVHLACQRHFQTDEAVEDNRFRLVAARGGKSQVIGDFTVRHHWSAPL
jgi:hypothetical protein